MVRFVRKEKMDYITNAGPASTQNFWIHLSFKSNGSIDSESPNRTRPPRRRSHRLAASDLGTLRKTEPEILALPAERPTPPKMITKFMTEVTTRFNPFSPNARSARLFLSLLPPNARQTMAVSTTLLSQKSTEPSSLKLKFSALEPPSGRCTPWYMSPERARLLTNRALQRTG